MEIVANWLISPIGWTKAEYDFFISISRFEGNHFKQTTGALCDGIFLLIWSVTGIRFVGSWRADIRLGGISLISFFYDFLPFFLLACPSWTFFRSQSITWPFIVPATIMVGSFGLNSNVKIYNGDVRIKRGSIACRS